MSLWMSSNKMGSERSVATQMARSNSIPYYGESLPTPSATTKLLLTGESGFTDSSSNNYTITNDDAFIEATIRKIQFNSFGFNTAGFSAAAGVDTAISGCSYLQFDCWSYSTDLSINGTSSSDLIRKGQLNGSTPEWKFGPTSQGELALTIYGSGSTLVAQSTSQNLILTNTWQHLAFSIDKSGGGNTLAMRMFVDGVKCFDYFTASFPVNTTTDYTESPLILGGNTFIGAYTGGYVDEVRVLRNDSNIWTENFTPAPLPYQVI